MLAGATDALVAALRRFGHELGMAYQITDDVLDLVADEEELGKAGGSDLRQGLLTLPILLYLQEAAEDCPVRDVLAGQQDEQHVQAAILAIRSSGAIAAALVEARAYVCRPKRRCSPCRTSRRDTCSPLWRSMSWRVDTESPVRGCDRVGLRSSSRTVLGPRSATYIVQGSGNVGSWTARLMKPSAPSLSPLRM